MNYISGNVFDKSNYSSHKSILIPHICNNLGGWGAGFVLALSKVSKVPEAAYRALKKYELGYVQFVNTEENIWIANMIAQNGYKSGDNPCPLDYNALDKCLNRVIRFTNSVNGEIHSPKFGAGLGGGDWEKISALIEKQNCGYGLDINIYTL